MKWLRLLAKLKPEDIQHVEINLEDIKRDSTPKGPLRRSGAMTLDVARLTALRTRPLWQCIYEVHIVLVVPLCRVQ
jgi:hypothetical protein